MMAPVGGLGAPSTDVAPHHVIHVWRGEGDAPAGQHIVITEDVARRFGLFAALLDDYDDDLVILPCPATDADVKLMVAMLAYSARPAEECPICYETLGDNHRRTGCCSQQIHSACLSRALASTPTCPLCRQAGALRRAAEPRGPPAGPPLPADAVHFLRFYASAHHLNCSAVVDVCAEHLAGLFRGKTVEQIVTAFGQCAEQDTLYDDLVRLALGAMPYSAAATMCQKFRAWVLTNSHYHVEWNAEHSLAHALPKTGVFELVCSKLLKLVRRHNKHQLGCIGFQVVHDRCELGLVQIVIQ